MSGLSSLLKLPISTYYAPVHDQNKDSRTHDEERQSNNRIRKHEWEGGVKAVRGLFAKVRPFFEDCRQNSASVTQI